MHKLSVPIMLSTVNEKTRDKYIKQCREAGVHRVFLCLGSLIPEIPHSLEETVSYFKAAGFEVGVWVDTIGHGVVLTHAKADLLKFSPIVDIKGRVSPYTNCPLDENFRSYITSQIEILAETEVDFIMLDDDFRMSQHGGERCCGCEKHLKRISEILGEEITLDKIRPYVVSGKPNKYRNAWLEVQNEGLIDLAKDIRSAIDKHNPKITATACSCISSWNVDGVNVAEITRILAGKNKPILRTAGAPYWAAQNLKNSLVASISVSRMIASFVENEGFDLMAEGDVYPRPRYTCPSSFLQVFDAATRIEGSHNGILKYMFDYCAGPDFETGYLQAHNEGKEHIEKLAKLFEGGANDGVRVIVSPHTIKNANLDNVTLTDNTPTGIDGIMLSSCSIPTVYKGEGICLSVFGENARNFDVSLLDNGGIIDSVSAMILTEKGIDVGIESFDPLIEKNIDFLQSKNPEDKSFITDGNIKYLPARLKSNAESLVFTPDGEIVAYRYENDKKQRFLVFLFEGDSLYHYKSNDYSGIIKNYVIADALTENIPWVARKPLPAFSKKNPDLLILCNSGEKEKSVGLFNCFADPLLNPVIILDDEYDSIEAVGCEAILEGNRVKITSKLYPYSSAVFKVSKK